MGKGVRFFPGLEKATESGKRMQSDILISGAVLGTALLKFRQGMRDEAVTYLAGGFEIIAGGVGSYPLDEQ